MEKKIDFPLIEVKFGDLAIGVEFFLFSSGNYLSMKISDNLREHLSDGRLFDTDSSCSVFIW